MVYSKKNLIGGFLCLTLGSAMSMDVELVVQEQESREQIKEELLPQEKNGLSQEKGNLKEVLIHSLSRGTESAIQTSDQCLQSVTQMDKISMLPSAFTGVGAIISIGTLAYKLYTKPVGTDFAYLIGDGFWLLSALTGVVYNYNAHIAGKK